jgi:hypothetical protein
LVNRPRERKPRLTKTDKDNAVFLTRDIKNVVKLQRSIGRWNIKRHAALMETFHRNVTVFRKDKITH